MDEVGRTDVGLASPTGTRSFATHRAVASAPQVIDVRLNAPTEMFELPPTDLFTEYRNHLTGIDLCLSELRSRPSRRPVTLRIHLPENQIADDTGHRIARTLNAFCNQRHTYNRRERRALRFDGASALRIGIPITVVGLAMTAGATHLNQTSEELERTILDHLGWVLAWVGLWFPLDVFFFGPHSYNRENRALDRLRVAEVEVVTSAHDLSF